jgi:hypothetical protein
VVEKEAAKLKNKAMAICEAIPKAIDTAGDVIMATLFPSDATALGNMLAVRAFPNSNPADCLPPLSGLFTGYCTHHKCTVRPESSTVCEYKSRKLRTLRKTDTSPFTIRTCSRPPPAARLPRPAWAR